VDSRPALALKGWSEDEWEFGRRQELKAFNVPLPEERGALEQPTADIAVDAPFSDPKVLQQAVFSYNLASRLSRDAIVEYERHLRTFATHLLTYQSHMDSMRAQAPMLEADR